MPLEISSISTKVDFDSRMNSILAVKGHGYFDLTKHIVDIMNLASETALDNTFMLGK